MRRQLFLVAAFAGLTGLLSACQPALSGKPRSDVTPNAVAGDVIEVTALDALPGEAPVPAATDAKPAGAGTAAPQATPAGAEGEATVGPEAAAAGAAPKPDLAATPVTPKSEKQLACEKKKGTWAKIGKGDARACIYQTKDAGKRCERESQCDGVCLARSGTCAPFKPLYGCNEILQDNGARVTLCLD